MIEMVSARRRPQPRLRDPMPLRTGIKNAIGSCRNGIPSQQILGRQFIMHICQQVIAEESEEELIWSDFVRQQGQHLIHKS